MAVCRVYCKPASNFPVKRENTGNNFGFYEKIYIYLRYLTVYKSLFFENEILWFQ